MHKNHSTIHFFYLITLIVLMVGVVIYPVKAQTPTETPTPETANAAEDGNVWSDPVNLSKSGAATQPNIFAAQDGRLQAFWLDRFDGLMTALFNGEAWSLPVQSTRPTSFFIVKPQNITFMPYLMSDLQDRVHAIWFNEAGSQGDSSGLYYNQIQIGQTDWTAPLKITDSAPVFNARTTGDGGIQIAIIRTLNAKIDARSDIVVPPGVYSSRSSADTRTWGPFSAIDTSIYYRIINPESSNVNMAVQDSAVFLSWTEPRLNQPLFSTSTDGGITWTAPSPFGFGSSAIKEPMLTVLPEGKALRIWQDEGAGRLCAFSNRHGH